MWYNRDVKIIHLQLIEHYHSVQGEGLRAGQPAYFVRFARCNLRCSWCDSAYTFGKGHKVSLYTVGKAILRSGVKYVCLTGGEPLLHIKDIVRWAKFAPAHLHFDIETGGSLDIAPAQLLNSSIIMDWKLRHSGMAGKMREKNLTLLRRDADMLKLVTDGSAVEQREMKKVISRTEKFGVPLSIQPVWGADPALIAKWVLKQRNPRLRFNLQLHKYIWPGEKTGV